MLLLGDGAAGFSLMDADSMVRHGLPVVMVVGNNGMWGLEKHPMQAIYGWDVACDLQPGCRYDEVVRALGGAGETVTEAGEIGPALDRAFASGVPYLVNVMTDPADVYPRTLEPRLSRCRGHVAQSLVEEAVPVDEHSGDPARGDQAARVVGRDVEHQAAALDLLEHRLGHDLDPDGGRLHVVDLDPHPDRGAVAR